MKSPIRVIFKPIIFNCQLKEKGNEMIQAPFMAIFYISAITIIIICSIVRSNHAPPIATPNFKQVQYCQFIPYYHFYPYFSRLGCLYFWFCSICMQYSCSQNLASSWVILLYFMLVLVSTFFSMLSISIFYLYLLQCFIFVLGFFGSKLFTRICISFIIFMGQQITDFSRFCIRWILLLIAKASASCLFAILCSFFIEIIEIFRFMIIMITFNYFL